ncbi:hypothetical protein HDV02_002692 [Globomyces sp. JEL0801]|nr:hypothetical protein HDV02_002692 [Globomyces sp. JEL0801]
MGSDALQKPRHSKTLELFRISRKSIGTYLVFTLKAIFSLALCYVIYFVPVLKFLPSEWQDVVIPWTLIWVTIEVGFLLAVLVRVYYCSSIDHLPTLNAKEFRLFLAEIQSPRSIENAAEYLKGWFYGSDIGKIGKQDIMQWLSALLYNQIQENMTVSQISNVLVLMRSLEKRLGIKFDDVPNPNTKKMMLTHDPIEISFRPLIFYASMRFVATSIRLIYWRHGFQRKSKGSMVSYYRAGTSCEPSLVFFHGIGIGLGSYTRFILALVKKYPTRTIVLFEMPSVAMRLSLTHCLPEEFANLCAERLLEVGSTDNIVIGHSLGTALVRWMDYFHPNLVQHRIFVDPICFSLWTSDVAYNFVYRCPEKSQAMFLMKYFSAMEPGIALYLRRYFVWHHNTYFTEHLPKNCKIYLSERDSIVNTNYVSGYLERHPHDTREVDILKGLAHGDFLLGGNYNCIFSDISRMGWVPSDTV